MSISGAFYSRRGINMPLVSLLSRRKEPKRSMDSFSRPVNPSTFHQPTVSRKANIVYSPKEMDLFYNTLCTPKCAHAKFAGCVCVELN